MTVTHLDPWTDIVSVHWPTTYTHVAFDLVLSDSHIGGTTYDYPSTNPGDPPGSFFTTSVATVSQKATIQGRYRMRTAGTTQTWSGASSSDLVITGYPDFSSTQKTFTGSYAECAHWSPINGTIGPPTFTNNQAMLGFDSQRLQDTLISVPIATGEKFQGTTTAALVFHTYPLSACVATTPATTLNTATTERVEISADVLSGVSLTYKGGACTIIGLWTPLLGLTPSPSIPLVQTPKRLFVLASID